VEPDDPPGQRPFRDDLGKNVVAPMTDEVTAEPTASLEGDGPEPREAMPGYNTGVSEAHRRDDLRIVVIGAGPGGLCMGVKLKEAGFENFTILERSVGVGGTWRRNTYPGAACDVPSALYSFSFEIKADWSRPYAPQPDILAYMEHLAESYGLLPHCRFGVEVRRAVWDEPRATWTVELATGETIVADIVVSALGMFNDLVWPDIEGLESFAGTTFHSAEWNWDHDLAGERVAVIGSAASAVQLVPEIVKQAERVHLFQRSANWVLPKPDTPYTADELESFRADPTPILALATSCSGRWTRG
jgi:cation diffusion facilitator CzcD-associated flavoprotein CzcO